MEPSKIAGQATAVDRASDAGLRRTALVTGASRGIGRAIARMLAARGAEILAQHPLGRVAMPDEIAQATVFCALDAPAAMTGSIIDVNGASYLRT